MGCDGINHRWSGNGSDAYCRSCGVDRADVVEEEQEDRIEELEAALEHEREVSRVLTNNLTLARGQHERTVEENERLRKAVRAHLHLEEEIADATWLDRHNESLEELRAALKEGE